MRWINCRDAIFCVSELIFVKIGDAIFCVSIAIKTYFSFQGLTPYEKGNYKFNTVIIYPSGVLPAWQTCNGRQPGYGDHAARRSKKGHVGAAGIFGQWPIWLYGGDQGTQSQKHKGIKA